MKRLLCFVKKGPTHMAGLFFDLSLSEDNVNKRRDGENRRGRDSNPR